MRRRQLKIIKRYKNEVLAGPGTVTSPEQAEAGFDAGAEFQPGPGLSLRVTSIADKLGKTRHPRRADSVRSADGPPRKESNSPSYFAGHASYRVALLQIRRTNPRSVAPVLRTSSKTRSIPIKGISPATIIIGSNACVAIV